MGRFLNRDPIEEAGGLNLYAFVGNDPVNRWDTLGLQECGCSAEYLCEVDFWQAMDHDNWMQPIGICQWVCELITDTTSPPDCESYMPETILTSESDFPGSDCEDHSRVGVLTRNASDDSDRSFSWLDWDY